MTMSAVDRKLKPIYEKLLVVKSVFPHAPYGEEGMVRDILRRLRQEGRLAGLRVVLGNPYGVAYTGEILEVAEETVLLETEWKTRLLVDLAAIESMCLPPKGETKEAAG